MIEKYFTRLPYKKKWVIFAFIVWNLLFIPAFIDFFKTIENEVNITSKIIYPLIFAITSCLLLIFSKNIREMVLKEGKAFKDIRKDCFLVLGVSFLILFMHFGIN